MSEVRAFPPQPSVEHLPTIFRRIDGGKIVIPAFQRSFVWEEAQILALLESVYAGYPIGSVLLWLVDSPILRLSASDDVPFPQNNPSYPLSFVLDGLQRLSTLYGVFHYGDKTDNRLFDVRFDLRDKVFLYKSSLTPQRLTIPLSSLFNPRRLLSIQQDLLNRHDGDRYISVVTDLQARFQEYMVPIVNLSNRSVDEVVVIFERVNSTGVRLSRVDFMRAVTWSEEFDLNDALADISHHIEERGLELPEETIVKALGIVFDLDPVPNVLIKLRRIPAVALNGSIATVKGVFDALISYIYNDAGIFSTDFIPYEGQILVLFRIFLNSKIDNSYGADLDRRQRGQIFRWLFWSSIQEYLQGKPDNFVARLIRNVDGQIRDGFLDIPSATVEESKFIRRRLVKGKALTAAFVILLMRHNARDPFSRNIIDPILLTSSYDSRSFLPILPLEELASLGIGTPATARFPANVLVCPSGHRDPRSGREIIADLIGSHEGWDVLRSQFIDETCVDALKASDSRLFLTQRARLMSRASYKILF